MPQITLNGQACVSLRTFFPAVGVWFADVDVDLLSTGLDPLLIKAPSGPAALTIAADNPVGPPTTLLGQIDSQFSGRFAGSGRVRVVGGRGGWDKSLSRQQFVQQPLLSTVLYAATAAEAGELPPIDPTPVVFDEGYERVAGPAARVFADRPWHVDPTTGVALVAPWPPIPVPPTDLELLGFDGNARRFEAAASSLLLPGLQLVDVQLPPRWDGIYTVVDVEQTFTAEHGSRASLWVTSGAGFTGATRLMSALTNLVRETSRRDLTRALRYRVVLQTGSKLTLQAVDAGKGGPDMVTIPMWGAPGLSAMLLPSSLVLVLFADGDPAHPRAVIYDPSLPLDTTLDATLAVNVGPSAPVVALAGGVTPLVLGPWGVGLAAALATFATACTSSTDATLAAAATALGTAITALPTPTTVKTVAA